MNKSKWKKWIGIIISLVALGYLLKNLIKSYKNGEITLEQINAGYFVFGILTVVVAYLILGFLWKEIYDGLYNKNVKYYVALSMMSLPNIMRYIPGKLWFVFGIAYWANRWNLKVVDAVVTSLVMMAVSLSASVGVGIMTGTFSTEENIPVWLLVGWILLTVIFFTTPAFPFFLRKTVKLFKKEYSFEIKKIPFKVFVKSFLIGILYWMIMGLSAYITGLSFEKMDIFSLPDIIGAFSVAYFIGYVTLISPAGLGIREGAFVSLLPKTMNTGEKVILSFLSRITMTVAEITVLIIVIIIIKLKEGVIFAEGEER